MIQPAIFAIQVALVELYRSWGIIPDAVVGHSAGEIAAAYAAGVITLEDAIRVIYHRSRLMQRATGNGRMAALGMTADDAAEVIRNIDDPAFRNPSLLVADSTGK